MQHENMQLRDPVMYRIRRGHHWRTGDEWVIYPTYDWAHGQSDAIEGVTHSLCTLEFDSHRALYDWYLEHLPLPGDKPRQTEFARLEFTHTITSKRRLATTRRRRRGRRLGRSAHADAARRPPPRLPRRGHPRVLQLHRRCPHQQPALDRAVGVVHPPSAQRDLAAPNGRLATIEAGHHQLADDAAGNPVVEYHEVVNNPENAADGTRQVPFSKVLYIEHDDFMEDAPRSTSGSHRAARCGCDPRTS